MTSLVGYIYIIINMFRAKHAITSQLLAYKFLVKPPSIFALCGFIVALVLVMILQEVLNTRSEVELVGQTHKNFLASFESTGYVDSWIFHHWSGDSSPFISSSVKVYMFQLQLEF